jgi:hypothetical protein
MRKLNWKEIAAAPLLVHSRPMAFIERPWLLIVVFLEIGIVLSAGEGFRQGWNQGGLIGAVNVALLGACVGAIVGTLSGAMFAAVVWLFATIVRGADHRKTAEILGNSSRTKLEPPTVPNVWTREVEDDDNRSEPPETAGS